jgi:modulator of FtsH protease
MRQVSFPPSPPPGAVQYSARSISINKVLRQTYMLLAFMLVAGAVGALVANAFNFGIVNRWLYLAFALAMPFVIHATRNSVMGLVFSFVYTFGLGFIAGPIVSLYASAIGVHVPVYAFGTTALVFFALTGYVLTTKKDFSFLRGFLIAGSVAVLLAIVANFFLQMSVLSLVLSSVIVVLSSAGILYSTSAAVNGGEDNYITLATGIFADLWAMFMSLMNIFGFFSGDE